MTGACVAVAAFALLAAGCGSSSPASSARSTHVRSALAYSHCMRTHGVPNFPDPDAQGDFPQFDLGVPKPTASAADSACRHFMSSGDTGTPQQRRQKFAFALKVARCLRAHEYPNFPDPTASGQAVPPGVDTRSPQFQAVETSCEKQEQKALGLP